MTEEYLKKC